MKRKSWWSNAALWMSILLLSGCGTSSKGDEAVKGSDVQNATSAEEENALEAEGEKQDEGSHSGEAAREKRSMAWQIETRTQKSTIYRAELTLPEDWLILDSASGSFYSDPQRRISIYCDIADGFNGIPTEEPSLRKIAEAGDIRFIQASGELSVTEPEEPIELMWEEERETAEIFFRSGVLRDASARRYPAESASLQAKSENGAVPMILVGFCSEEADSEALKQAIKALAEEGIHGTIQEREAREAWAPPAHR
ncbi:MAG: hypothetical protein SOR89_02430 [Ndongobacter sp.]|nr:hypothetical protein [Ndongobacter sp.]